MAGELDDFLKRYIAEDEVPTPIAGNRTYVLGKLMAVIERTESTLREVGASWDPRDPFKRAALLRGIFRIRDLLNDVERHIRQYER